MNDKKYKIHYLEEPRKVYKSASTKGVPSCAFSLLHLQQTHLPLVTSRKHPGLWGRGKYMPLSKCMGEQATLLVINGSFTPIISTCASQIWILSFKKVLHLQQTWQIISEGFWCVLNIIFLVHKRKKNEILPVKMRKKVIYRAHVVSRSVYRKS